jgi:cytochrome c-type biogenesis protein CcmH/NrfG
MARGSAAAAAALKNAVTLDPNDPRPRVYLGIIAARAASYAEALKHFQAAKALAPAYPNIDRFIEEAQKRR